MTTVELLSLIAVGLACGALGGMLGIGGSIIIIPVLTILFGRNIHLAEAVAMIINVFVAVPSTIQHTRAKSVDWAAVRRMLPAAIVFIIIGVMAGNALDGHILEGIFGAFLLYIVVHNLQIMFARKVDDGDGDARCHWWRVGIIGALIGFAAGLLGIGGGTLTVPLLQRICHFPLRLGIGTSAAVMVLTAVVGAFWKNWTLATHEVIDPVTGATEALHVGESMLLAGCLAPTAFIGGMLGAKLTHVLPLTWVRIAFVTLLALAAVRMLMSAFGM